MVLGATLEGVAGATAGVAAGVTAVAGQCIAIQTLSQWIWNAVRTSEVPSIRQVCDEINNTTKLTLVEATQAALMAAAAKLAATNTFNSVRAVSNTCTNTQTKLTAMESVLHEVNAGVQANDVSLKKIASVVDPIMKAVDDLTITVNAMASALRSLTALAAIQQMESEAAVQLAVIVQTTTNILNALKPPPVNESTSLDVTQTEEQESEARALGSLG